jgi:dehydrogenase/reductase SDR family protein 12
LSASCIYEGTIRHRRLQPRREFTHRLALAYLDLEELPRLLDGRLVGRRPALVPVRRRDYLGDPDVSPDRAVRDLVNDRTGWRPKGPIRVLTHLRSLGHCFNPVSFYYCLGPTGASVQNLVAEVTNTPWGERHAERVIDSVLDMVLDRSVIGGYSKLGYRIRSRGWSDAGLPPMPGKVVLISGASSGLGYAAAEGFARLGATVWLLVRSRERGEAARDRISERSGNADIHVGVCDLAKLTSVRKFTQGFREQVARLDVLVNNAGVLTDERTLSSDAIELTLATNVVGPFLLTNLLVPLLEQTAPARIINVSSGGMYTQRIRVDDLQSERGRFDGARAYARTKRAQVVLTEIWARRLAGTGVVVHSMHPGWSDTPGIRSSLPGFYKAAKPLLRTAAEGADTITWLGAAPEPGQSSGQFWQDRRPRPTHLLPWTKETAQERERFWEQCVELSGWQEPQTGRSAARPE